MLLLIALANVPSWVTVRSLNEDRLITVDRVWLMMRVCFIDQRSYPLFAALFGFGIAVMVQRYRPERTGLTPSQFIRRRGWWMLLIGGVHAVLYFGDIIGAYAVLALAFGVLFAGKYRRVFAAIGCVAAVVTMVGSDAPTTVGSSEVAGTDGFARLANPDYTMLSMMLDWAMNSLFAVFAGGIVASVVAGYFIGSTTWLSEPNRHRRFLTVVAVVGLAVGAVSAVPIARVVAGYREFPMNITGDLYGAAFSAGGLFGAAGWLALFALVGGRVQGRFGDALDPQHPAEFPLVVRTLIAVGRRSMTAYLAQSVCFAVVFLVFHLAGVHDQVGPAGAAFVAVVVWFAIAVWCVVLDCRGIAGPAERFLRSRLYRPASTAMSRGVHGV